MKTPLDIATKIESSLKDVFAMGVSTNFTYSYVAGTTRGMDDSNTWD